MSVEEWMHRSTFLWQFGGERSASNPARFTPGTRAGLEEIENRKFFTLLGLELDHLVAQPLANRYTYYTGAVLCNFL
jgi:hypothetical protein